MKQKRKPVTESKWGLCSKEGPVWLKAGIKQQVVKMRQKRQKRVWLGKPSQATWRSLLINVKSNGKPLKALSGRLRRYLCFANIISAIDLPQCADQNGDDQVDTEKLI